MSHPGIWVIGDLDDDDRGHGMDMVVAYDGEKGELRWSKPGPFKWDNASFGKPGASGFPTRPSR